jgi:iron complex outermembrane receptor protein
VTGGATLSYKVNPDVTTYVAYGRSYRGRTAAVGITAPLDQSLLVSQPETSNSGELGVKATLFDRRVNVNFGIFYQTFDDYIGRTTGVSYSSARNGVIDGGSEFNFNGDAKSKGAETTIAASLTDSWDLTTSLSYVDAEFDNAMAPCNDFNGDGIPDSVGIPTVPVGQQVSYCLRNDRIAEVPKFSASMTSEYRFQSGSVEPFIRGLYTYQPGFFSTAASFDYQSRSILNLFAGVRGPDDRWEVTAFAKNLFDQKRITNGMTGTFTTPTINGVPFDSGYTVVTTTLPREIGLTVQFNF